MNPWDKAVVLLKKTIALALRLHTCTARSANTCHLVASTRRSKNNVGAALYGYANCLRLSGDSDV